MRLRVLLSLFNSYSRGIRQGDPLSPVLFSLMTNIMFRILSRAEAEGKLSGIKISRTSPRITYLMYADDLVIYCKTNIYETQVVKSCLDLYHQWSRQQINWEKSDIHFSVNMRRTSKSRICRMLGMRECTHTGRYLGSPFCRFKSKNAEFNYIIEKMSSKLVGWKTDHLSMAGRLTLIKAVTSALPSYIMQLFFTARWFM